MISSIKLFLIIYFICMGFIYALQSRRSIPVMVPGDIYISKGQKKIYIPLGLTFILTLIIFLILNNIRLKMGVEF